MSRHMDPASFITALITFMLFVPALFATGLTHDLVLEAGVFLVSVKLIMMAYKNGVANGHLDEKLDSILAELSKRGDRSVNTANYLEALSNSKK